VVRRGWRLGWSAVADARKDHPQIWERADWASLTGRKSLISRSPESAILRRSIELTELKRSEDSKTNIVMGFRVVSITADGKTYTPDAEVVSASIDRVRSQDRGDDAKKVAGGAAVGAVVGQVLGRNTKGTLIGAAVGAAAGAAAASSTSDYEGCVNAGAAIAIRLTGPLTVSI
jgi:hypothetical protein